MFHRGVFVHEAKGRGKSTLSQCRDSIYSISRPSRLNIDVAAWRTQDGRESDCVDIYIYIRFQWTTGCIEEEIVIVSDRSDRKLVSNASDASCARETEWQWTISAFEDSLSQLSWLAKRDNDSFPPAIRRVLFFFKLEREEVIKKRLYPWDKIKPSVYTIAIISFFSTIFKQKFIKSIEFSVREKVFDRRVLHLDTIKLII